MDITIEDLLNALQNPDEVTLENNSETWRRIANKDNFDELGLGSDLDDFLKDWIEKNPYSNI